MKRSRTTWKHCLRERTAVERDAFLEGDTGFTLAHEPSLAGQTIGAYTLREPIGQGGMGSVWRAERSDGRYQAGRGQVPEPGSARARRRRALRARRQHAGAPDASEHRAAVGCGRRYQCHGRRAALSRS